MIERIPENWKPLLTDAVSAAVIIFVAVVFYLLANRIFKLAVAKGTISEPVGAVFRVVIRWILSGLTVLMVLQQFGILQNAWAAVLALLAMVAIGFFAVWSILSNILCTLLILIYRPYRIGDNVEIPSDSIGGKVIDLNFLYTTLKEESGGLIQVPNNTFFQKPIRRIRGKKHIELYDQLKKAESTE